MSGNDLGAPAEQSPAEQSPAERLRSLLVAADSLTLLTPGHRADLVGRHRIDSAGRLAVEIPAGCAIARQMCTPDGSELVAVVEITDVAPVAVRDRIRGRATLSGWLIPTGPPTSGELPAVLDLATAELSVRGPTFDNEQSFSIEPEELAAARPDPLAQREADLLGHLADQHGAVVDRLTRLVSVVHLQGVRRVHPLRLDRYGLVLRLEYAGRDRDVRLPFASPLDHADELETHMQGLLALARRCRRERVGGS